MGKMKSRGFFNFVLVSAILVNGWSNTQAATITYTRDQVSTATNWGPLGAVDIPQFDPTLGTLTQVDMALTGTMTSTMVLQNNSSSNTNVLSGSVFVSLSANFAILSDSLLQSAAVPGTPFVILGNEEVTIPLNDTNSNTTTLSAPGDDLSAFIGTGNLSYDWMAQGGFGISTLGGNTTAQVTTFAEAQLEITYTYEPARGTIIVEKQTDPDNDPTQFTFTGDAAGAIADNGQIVVTDLLPGTYTSTEILPAGWTLTSITLDDGASTTPSSGDINTGIATFELDPGETVKAVFTNTVQRGTIIVEKQTDPDNDPTQFSFTGDAAGAIADNGQIVVADLLPGTYTSTEIVPAGWTLTSITLDDGASTTPSSGDTNTGVATFELDPGETVKAVFTNTVQRGTIIIEKLVDTKCPHPDDGSVMFDFTGDIAGSISHGQQIVVADLPVGQYSSMEIAPNGWEITNISLDDGNSSSIISSDNKKGTITFQLEADETIKAVVTNTKPPVKLTLSATPGGRIVCPGEGTFEVCPKENICIMAESTDPLFAFVGLRGGFFADPSPDGDGHECIYVCLNADTEIRAQFVSLLDTLYVDAGHPGDAYENGTPEYPFNTIQEAVDVAGDGSTIIVRSGLYREVVDIQGKSIHLTGAEQGTIGNSNFPIIDGQGNGPVVRFAPDCSCDCGVVLDAKLTGLIIQGGEHENVSALALKKANARISNCIIAGNQLRQKHGAIILCEDSNAVFENCTLADNRASEGYGIVGLTSHVAILNSILWNDTAAEIVMDEGMEAQVSYSLIKGGYVGMDNQDTDPLFAQEAVWPSHLGLSWLSGDYHLKSEAGRWDPSVDLWVDDDVTSPGVDAGNPDSLILAEPEPNGARINMGAYGGTDQASMSPAMPGPGG